MEEFYPLSRLLTVLGSPDAIDIATFSNYGSHGQLEFTLLIEYEQIRAFYNFEGEKQEDFIRACLKSQLVGPRLELGEQLSYSGSGSSNGILPMETATGMSIETFMLQFQDPNNDLCLETSAELWP